MVRKALRMCPGNQLIVAVILVTEFMSLNQILIGFNIIGNVRMD